MENLCYVRDDQSPVDKEYSEQGEFGSTHFSYGGLLSYRILHGMESLLHVHLLL